MKSKEELNALKEEVEAVSKKLVELTEDELTQVTGGDVTNANIVGNCAVSDIRPKGIDYPNHEDIPMVEIHEISPRQMDNKLIAEEYSNMIKTQRASQINSKILTTSDENFE